MIEDRIETEAYKTSAEINKKIYREDTYFYKPWQFVDYRINSNTLKTTYEEIYIWTKQQAMFRPGFKIDDKTVCIPNIFAKVNGTHRSKRQYKKEIKLLRKENNTLFFRAFPMYRKKPSKLISRDYYSLLDASGYLDKNKLLLSKLWKYRQLRTSLQKEIAERILDFCNLLRFKNYELWSGEEQTDTGIINKVTDFLQNFDITINLNYNTSKLLDKAKIRVFNILMELEEPLITLLSQFDYPFYVPKIVIYNNGNKASKVTFEDAVKLMFMSSMGVDVIIFNPAGYNDIEDFIREKYYDIHRLEEVAYNLTLSPWHLF